MVMMAPPLAQAIRARAVAKWSGVFYRLWFYVAAGEKLTQAWIHQQLALIQPKTGHYPDESGTSVRTAV